MNGHFSRPSLHRSLLLVLLNNHRRVAACQTQQANVLFKHTFSQACPLSGELLPDNTWQLHEASRDCLAQASIRAGRLPDTQYCIRSMAREAFQERPHLYFGSQMGDPHELTGRSHQSGRKKSEGVWLLCYVGFSWAPSGMAPYSKYCQSATNSLRASATMPIRRTRLLPFAKRF